LGFVSNNEAWLEFRGQFTRWVLVVLDPAAENMDPREALWLVDAGFRMPSVKMRPVRSQPELLPAQDEEVEPGVDTEPWILVQDRKIRKGARGASAKGKDSSPSAAEARHGVGIARPWKARSSGTSGFGASSE
jgi:hypothetical protein